MRRLTLLTAGLLACTAPEKDPEAQESPADTAASLTPYGPENSWYHAPDASLVPDEPAEDRWSRGEQVPNLRFTDQHGDEVWLYQFYGKTLYIDWVAEWCGPCNSYAPYLEAFNQSYGDDAIVLTVLVEDSRFRPGDAAAVGRWTETHDSTNPVLWLDEEQARRIAAVDAYPEINLIDPQLRFAVKSVNSLHGDAYIEQVVDRMIFAIGGSTDLDAEVCEDGLDNDLDLIADCMDDACVDAPGCAQTEVSGSLSPCTPDPDDLVSHVDVWQLEVRGAVAWLEGDAVSEATGFEHIVEVRAPGAERRNVGDDEWGCTWPLEDFGCARGWIRPGTWELIVRPGTGGSEYDGDCVNPELGEYLLRIRGDVSLELVRDDIELQDL